MTELQKINAEIDQLECMYEYLQVYGRYEKAREILTAVAELKQMKKELENEVEAGT